MIEPSPAPAPEARPPARRGLGAHLVGAFIALHLLAITLKAVPTPEAGMDKGAWHDPTVQAEFNAWRTRLAALGLKATPQQFEDFLWGLAERYLRLRGAVLEPFEPYYHHCGTYQGWQMFVAPQRFPTRFEVEVEEGGAWRPVFVEGDPSRAWLATELGDTRFRSVLFRLAWPNYRLELEQFTDWVARRAARDFPSATKARVRLYRYRTPSPEETLTHAPVDGHYDAPLERELKGLR